MNNAWTPLHQGQGLPFTKSGINNRILILIFTNDTKNLLQNKRLLQSKIHF